MTFLLGNYGKEENNTGKNFRRELQPFGPRAGGTSVQWRTSHVAGRLVLCHYHDSLIPKVGLLGSVQFEKAGVIYDEMQKG